ncbi:MAG TPA: VWA domain-containing protein [Chitinophagales bacterium]|nr:VWA domain-containing protein [Chitinophagales bacterium]
MARREIHIDYHLFLILFSKALGAMIILFIMVPKLTGDVKHKLEELEQLDELKQQVVQMDGMLAKLKKSVPEAVYKPLEQKFKEVQNTTKNLEARIESLQHSLAQCDNQRQFLQDRINKLEKELNALDSKTKESIETMIEVKEQRDKLQNELEVTKEQLKDYEQIKKNLENKGELEKQLVQLQEEVNKQLLTIKNQEDKLKTQTEVTQNTAEQIKQLQETIKAKDQTIKLQQQQIADCKPNPKTGFDIKDKNVVFVVDLSGSMDDAPETDKLDQVKAGLKMMVATMDENYKVDVVIFPKSKTEEYGYKYGKLTTVTESTKYDIYRYLSSLKAFGCTPTRQAMNYVLDEPAYKAAGTIILLSDGAPTKRVGQLDCDDDDIADVLADIKSKNSGRVINCIGVGSDFRNENMSNKGVKFMNDLARENKGFYIGF